MLGFVSFGYLAHSLVADHYQYLALIAVVALVPALVSRIKINAAWMSLAVSIAGSYRGSFRGTDLAAKSALLRSYYAVRGDPAKKS